jgi:tRNA pseudouridine(55) synthase
MGRKRKGRAVSGWLVVDKPAGITSTAVVNKVRWAFGAAKAGHAGTLDPAATGVLAVALGEATKTVPYITDALKCYRFMVRLGQSTTTDDAEGALWWKAICARQMRRLQRGFGRVPWPDRTSAAAVFRRQSGRRARL